VIRQAQTYLVGAVSGTALVGAAVVAFVLLVSLQALRDWPLAGIGDFGGESSQSAPSQTRGTAPGGSTTPAVKTAGGETGANAAHGGVGSGAGNARTGVDATSGQSPTAPTTTPQPGSNAPGGGAPNGSTTGSSSATAGGGSSPAGGSGKSSGTAGQSTSGAVTGAVNETVKGVDETTGGVVGETGVTKATEEVVNDVAGPESVVGKTVDETVKTVGGLLKPGQ
jgi:hypothetical protein